MKRAKPWRLTYVTPGAPVHIEYRSRPAALRAAEKDKQDVANGTSRTTSIVLEKWDATQKEWIFNERLWDHNTSTGTATTTRDPEDQRPESPKTNRRP